MQRDEGLSWDSWGLPYTHVWSFEGNKNFKNDIYIGLFTWIYRKITSVVGMPLSWLVRLSWIEMSIQIPYNSAHPSLFFPPTLENHSNYSRSRHHVCITRATRLYFFFARSVFFSFYFSQAVGTGKIICFFLWCAVQKTFQWTQAMN